MFIFFLFIISDHKRTFDERRLLQNHAGLAIRPIKSVGRRPESTWNGWWKEGNCQFAAGDSYFAVGDGVERERERVEPSSSCSTSSDWVGSTPQNSSNFVTHHHAGLVKTFRFPLSLAVAIIIIVNAFPASKLLINARSGSGFYQLASIYNLINAEELPAPLLFNLKRIWMIYFTSLYITR